MASWADMSDSDSDENDLRVGRVPNSGAGNTRPLSMSSTPKKQQNKGGRNQQQNHHQHGHSHKGQASRNNHNHSNNKSRGGNSNNNTPIVLKSREQRAKDSPLRSDGDWRAARLTEQNPTEADEQAREHRRLLAESKANRERLLAEAAWMTGSNKKQSTPSRGGGGGGSQHTPGTKGASKTPSSSKRKGKQQQQQQQQQQVLDDKALLLGTAASSPSMHRVFADRDAARTDGGNDIATATPSKSSKKKDKKKRGKKKGARQDDDGVDDGNRTKVAVGEEKGVEAAEEEGGGEWQWPDSDSDNEIHTAAGTELPAVVKETLAATHGGAGSPGLHVSKAVGADGDGTAWQWPDSDSDDDEADDGAGPPTTIPAKTVGEVTGGGVKEAGRGGDSRRASGVVSDASGWTEDQTIALQFFENPEWFDDAQQQPVLFASLKRRSVPILTKACDFVTAAGEVPSSLHDEVNAIHVLYQRLTKGVRSVDAQDDFAVEVYETAAEFMICTHEFNELLKCLTTLLRVLYPSRQARGLPTPRAVEFTQYNLLYFICFSRDPWEISNLTYQLSALIRAEASIVTALSLARALSDAGSQQVDYAMFHKIFHEEHTIYARHIIQTCIPFVRRSALQVAMNAYMQLPVEYVASHVLLYPHARGDAELSIHQLLSQYKCDVYKDPEDKTTLDCRAVRPKIRA